MTVMSKAWLKWGLRFPSAPTFRSGLSMLAVCCKLDLSPTQAHEHMLEFTQEFRKLRTLYPGDATLKVFPVDPSDFKSTHPEHIGDYVECRVDKNAIIELAHPKSIPCKTTNASLTPKKSSSSSSTSLCDGSQKGLLRGLLGMVLGEGGSSFSPEMMYTPPPRRARRVAPLAITDREEQPVVDDPHVELTPEAVVPPILDSREPISDEAGSLLLPAGHAGPSAAVVPVDNVAEQTAKFIQNRKEKNAALKEKEKEKQMAAALAAAGGHDQPIRKRVVGKTSLVTLLAREAATKGKKGKGPAKAKSKAKAKAKANKDAKPTAKAKKKTTETTSPTEAKPALDMENTVYYGGGRLYSYPKRKLFRVWLRTEDKKDKGVRYGDDPSPAHLQQKWNEALKLIDDDPRSVDVD